MTIRNGRKTSNRIFLNEDHTQAVQNHRQPFPANNVRQAEFKLTAQHETADSQNKRVSGLEVNSE